MIRGPWQLPDPRRAPPGVELLALSGTLSTDLAVAGYRTGLFAMEFEPGINAWFSPDPRAILPLTGMHISRSLRRSRRRMTVTFDQAFEAVVDACASPARSGAWINDEYRAVYSELHRRGHAHSVEVWTDRLVGGVFGVEFGGLFCGESMFHHRTDASKVALAALVDRLAAAGPEGRVLDVQWWTQHLGSLGVVEIPRTTYLDLLPGALALPAAFPGAARTR